MTPAVKLPIMGPISDCLHLTVNLKYKIYLYVYSTTQRYSSKIIKKNSFCRFLSLSPVTTIPVVYLELRISPRIKKNETALIGYSGVWGKQIHEKNLMSKISGTVLLRKQCFFAVVVIGSILHSLRRLIRDGETY
jgi:hypothetical protein